MEFEQVCDRILGRETFPDFDQVFALVRGAASQKELLHGKEDNGSKNPIEGSLLAVSKPNSKSEDSKMPAEKDKRWCDFCNRPRHTRDLQENSWNTSKFQGIMSN